jgi:antitoxin component YwqK of YwqJK toxin-antitoxin module
MKKENWMNRCTVPSILLFLFFIPSSGKGQQFITHVTDTIDIGVRHRDEVIEVPLTVYNNSDYPVSSFAKASQFERDYILPEQFWFEDSVTIPAHDSLHLIYLFDPYKPRTFDKKLPPIHKSNACVNYAELSFKSKQVELHFEGIIKAGFYNPEKVETISSTTRLFHNKQKLEETISFDKDTVIGSMNYELIEQYTSWYANGQTHETGTFYYPNWIKKKQNGSGRDGDWLVYYSNGQLKRKEHYENRMPAGIWTGYHKNGQIKWQGELSSNDFDSYDQLDYEIEKEFFDCTFPNKTGQWVWYYSNGKAKAKGAYKKGKPTGKWEFFHLNGTLKATLEMVRKKRYKTFHRTGRFHSGSGKKKAYTTRNWVTYFYPKTYEEYYDNGQLKYMLHFTNETYIRSGEMKTWYRNGKPMIEISQNNSKENTGAWKCWHPNGQLFEEIQFKDGEKTGIANQYTEDGTLCLSVQYPDQVILFGHENDSFNEEPLWQHHFDAVFLKLSDWRFTIGLPKVRAKF